MPIIPVTGYNTCFFKATVCFLRENGYTEQLELVIKKLRDFVRKNAPDVPKDVSDETLVDVLDQRAKKDLKTIVSAADMVCCPIIMRDKDMKELKNFTPPTTIADAVPIELVCVQQANALDHFDTIRKPKEDGARKPNVSFQNEANVPQFPTLTNTVVVDNNPLERPSTSSAPAVEQEDYEEISATQHGQSMRKALNEFKHQPIQEPPVDLRTLSNYKDVEELVVKLKEALKSTHQDSKDLSMSLLEELCWKCGIHNVFPKTIIVGMESVGKTSAIEAFLGMPLSYTSQKKATVTPMFIMIRKMNNLKENEYVCRLTRKGVTEIIPIEQLSSKMKQHMEKIKETEGYSLEPFVLTVETGSPKATTMSFIDVPGMIQSVSNDEHKDLSDEEKKKTVKKVKYITEYIVNENSDKDIVLIIDSLISPPSHHKISELPFLKQFNADRKLFAVTHGDLLVEKFKTADAKIIQEHVREYKNLFGKLPYLLALHEAIDKQDLNFESQRKHIICSGTVREKVFATFLEKKGVSQEIRDFVGVAKVRDAINQLRLQQFVTNASTLKTQIKEAVAHLNAQEKGYLERISLEQNASTDALLNTMIQELRREFLNTFKGNYSHLADKVAEQHRRTLKQEFENIGQLQLPSSITLNGVTMMPAMDFDFLCEHSSNWDIELSNGFQRVQRFISFLTLSVSSVEVENCDSGTIIEQQQSGFKANYVVGLAAIANVATKLAKRIFGDDACNYTQTFFITLIKNYLEFIQNIVAENPLFKAKKPLLEALVSIIEEKVEELIKSKIERVKKDICAVFDAVRVNEIEEMGILHLMVYSPNQDKQPELERRERIIKLSEIQNKQVDLNNTTVDELKRLFSSLREIFRMNIVRHIDALANLITGDDQDSLFETVHRTIFNKEDGSRKSVEELESEFKYKPETDSWISMKNDVTQRKAILCDLQLLFVEAIDRIKGNNQIK